MQISITGKGVDLTDAIDNYVTKKINELDKFFDGVNRASVVLGRLSNHHQKGDVFFAECTLDVPGNNVFGKKEAMSVYEAVDLMRDLLESELKKHKIKLAGNIKKNKNTAREVKEYDDAAV